MSKEKKIKKLQKENDSLVQNVLDKMEVIKELQNDYDSLTRDYITLANRKAPQAPAIPTVKKAPLVKFERWWNFSIELWPPAWGLSYYRYKHEANGSQSREGQIQLGPFGFSWNREPKR